MEKHSGGEFLNLDMRKDKIQLVIDNQWTLKILASTSEEPKVVSLTSDQLQKLLNQNYSALAPKISAFEYYLLKKREIREPKRNLTRFSHFVQASIQGYIDECRFSSALQTIEGCLDDFHVPSRYIIRQMAFKMCLDCDDVNIASWSCRILLYIMRRYGPISLDGLWRMGMEEVDFNMDSWDSDDGHDSTVNTCSDRRKSLADILVNVLSRKNCPQKTALLEVLARFLETDLVQNYQHLEKSIGYSLFHKDDNAVIGQIDIITSSLLLATQDANPSMDIVIGKLISYFCTLSLLDVFEINILLKAMTLGKKGKLAKHFTRAFKCSSNSEFIAVLVAEEYLLFLLPHCDTTSCEKILLRQRISSDKISKLFSQMKPFAKTNFGHAEEVIFTYLALIISWDALHPHFIKSNKDVIITFKENWEHFFDDEMQSSFEKLV